MHRMVFAVLLLVTGTCVSAQGAWFARFEDQDSDRRWFPEKVGKWDWSPLVGFDVQRSWLNGKFMKIRGFVGGITYRGIHKIGTGVHWSSKNDWYSFHDVDVLNSPVTEQISFEARYLSAFYDRVIYRSPRWNFSVPLSFSFGFIKGLKSDIDDGIVEFCRDPFSAVSTGLHAKVYLMTWLVPRFHLGYRYTFNATREVKESFDSVYLSWGLSVLPVELFKRIKSRRTDGIFLLDPRPI